MVPNGNRWVTVAGIIVLVAGGADDDDDDKVVLANDVAEGGENGDAAAKNGIAAVVVAIIEVSVIILSASRLTDEREDETRARGDNGTTSCGRRVNEATKTLTTTPAPSRIRINKIKSHCNRHHDRHDAVIVVFICLCRCLKILAMLGERLLGLTEQEQGGWGE